jgi:hypothetical protein
MPKMWPVHSGMIAAVGYEDDEVYIEYKNGDTWAYRGTDNEAHHCLAADSPGKYVNATFKPRGGRKIVK